MYRLTITCKDCGYCAAFLTGEELVVKALIDNLSMLCGLTHSGLHAKPGGKVQINMNWKMEEVPVIVPAGIFSPRDFPMQ